MAENRPTTGSAISFDTDLLEGDAEALDFSVDSLPSTPATQSAIPEGRSPHTPESNVKEPWGDDLEHQSPEIWPASRAGTATPVGTRCSVSSYVSGRSEFQAFPVAIYPTVEVCVRRCRSAPLEKCPRMATPSPTRARSGSCSSDSSPKLSSIPEETRTASVDAGCRGGTATPVPTPTPTPTPSSLPTLVEDEASDTSCSVSSQVSGRSEFQAFPFAIYPTVEVCARRCRSAPLDKCLRMAAPSPKRARSGSCSSDSSPRLSSIPEETCTASVDAFVLLAEDRCSEKAPSPFGESTPDKAMLLLAEYQCAEQVLPCPGPSSDNVPEDLRETTPRVSFWKKLWSRVKKSRSKRTRRAKDSPQTSSEVLSDDIPRSCCFPYLDYLKLLCK